MPPVFWLTVLFVLASGLSAYIGNSWGRKLGKRKLSVFALRPKHTSTFLTILLSMSLSLGLLGSWLLLSPQAREAMLYPPEQVRPLAEPVQLARQAAPRSASPVTSAAPADTAQAADPPSRVPTPAASELQVQAFRTAAVSRSDRPAASSPAPPAAASSTAPAARQTLPSPATAPASPAQPSAPDQRALASARAPERSKRLALAASAPSNEQPASARPSASDTSQPTETRQSQTLFALQVYGGLKPAESQQLLQGVLDLTRDYAQLMMASAESAPLLQIQSQELAQSQSRLQQAGVYQLQVSLQTSPQQQQIPVRLQLQPLPTTPNFDPHELLELARLENPAQSGNSLQEELHLAMQNLAAENRPAALRNPPEMPATASRQQLANLPFEIINLRRQGQTLQGQIIMAGSLVNLTEN